MTTTHFRTCPTCGLGISRDADGTEEAHECKRIAPADYLKFNPIRVSPSIRHEAMRLTVDGSRMFTPQWYTEFVASLLRDFEYLESANKQLKAFYEAHQNWMNAKTDIHFEPRPSRVMWARFLATMAHAGQQDRAGAPYIDHPAAVAAAVRHLGEDYEIAAWLHDVVEDCGISLDIISENFGGEVFEAVVRLTHNKMTPTFPTYENYIIGCRSNTIARAVKIADLKHNLLPERISKLKDPDGKRARYEAALATLEADRPLTVANLCP